MRGNCCVPWIVMYNVHGICYCSIDTVAILAQGTLSGRCVRRRPFWVLNATGFLGPPTQKSKASSGGPKHALLLGLGPGVAPGRVACCFDSRRRLSPFSRSIFVPRWRARACSGMLGRAGHAPSKAWVRPAPKFALPAGPGRAPASSPAWQFPARSAAPNELLCRLLR